MGQAKIHRNVAQNFYCIFIKVFFPLFFCIYSPDLKALFYSRFWRDPLGNATQDVPAVELLSSSTSCFVCLTPNRSPVLSLPALSSAVRALIGSLLACRDDDHANVLVLTNSQAHQNITTSAITQSWGQPNEHMPPSPLPDNPYPIPKLLFMCLI